MPKIIIEKPLKGLIPAVGVESVTSGILNTAKEGPQGSYSEASSMSLFRDTRYGHIAPGETFTALTDSATRITQLPLNAVTVSSTAGNETAWAVLANARIVKFDVGTNATSDHKDITLANGHSGHTSVGTVNYYDIISIFDAQATPVEYILWSWQDATDADIAIIKPDGTGQDDDWFSTLSGGAVLKRGVEHKMVQGPDGNVYITNGQFLASAVMTAGTALTSAAGNASALNLGAGYEATSIVPFDKFVVTGGQANKSATDGVVKSHCRVWFWDGFSPEPNEIKNIDDNHLYALHVFGDTLYAYTYGRNNTYKIHRYDGARFVKVFEKRVMGAPASRGGQTAFSNYQDGFVFIGMNSNIPFVHNYSNEAVHNRATVTDGTDTATSLGFCKNLYQTILYVGAAISGPSYKIYYTNHEGYKTNALFRTRVYPVPYRSTIKKIRIYFSQFAAASSVTVKLFDNQTAASGTAKYSKTITTTTEPEVTATLDATLFPNVRNVNAFYLNVTFDHSAVSDTAAIIRAIEVEYETYAEKT